jgi:hypothetical protein
MSNSAFRCLHLVHSPRMLSTVRGSSGQIVNMVPEPLEVRGPCHQRLVIHQVARLIRAAPRAVAVLRTRAVSAMRARRRDMKVSPAVWAFPPAAAGW